MNNHDWHEAVAAFVVWLCAEFWWWALGRARGAPVFPWGVDDNPWKRWIPKKD